ncbi:MAG: hypothetical protein ACR2OC_02930 [Solirubrobacterales bacterium]
MSPIAEPISRLVIVLTLALIALALTAALGSSDRAEGAPNVAGCTVFPDFSGAPDAKSAADQTAWNQDITKAPVHKRSKEIIKQINRDGPTDLHPDFGSPLEYGIPFTVVDANQPDVEVTIGPDGYPKESDFGPAPIPANARIEGDGADGDRHTLVVDSGNCGLYELYRAERLTGNSWQADTTAFFDLAQAGPLRPAGFTSADAAGLPIFPGLVRYDEAITGQIDHAIRVTFEETRSGYIPPATHQASDSCNKNRPPMGMRFRMKRSFYNKNLGGFPEGSQSRAIFDALYRFGMINADNGSNWFFSGGTDPRWDDDDLNRLKRIPGKAFEVVKSAAKEKTSC